MTLMTTLQGKGSCILLPHCKLRRQFKYRSIPHLFTFRPRSSLRQHEIMPKSADLGRFLQLKIGRYEGKIVTL